MKIIKSEVFSALLESQKRIAKRIIVFEQVSRHQFVKQTESAPNYDTTL